MIVRELKGKCARLFLHLSRLFGFTPNNPQQSSRAIKYLYKIGNQIAPHFAQKIKKVVFLQGDVANTDQSPTDYQEWIKLNDTFTQKELADLKNEIELLPYQPLVSIIMPVYNTDPQFLEIAIKSISAQLYTHWELCIADDASSRNDTKNVLKRFAAEDSRIKVTFREQNGHISAASNTALANATGEYIALCDHDDVLPAHALALVVKTLNKHPQVKIIYSDEDKIDIHEVRYDPYFKPDWNYDLLLSQNYVSHLGVYQHKLIKSVGGFREGLEGSQDYDLLLRCIEQLKPEEILHIPHILYHWRAIPGSAALSADEKDYARLAALKAIKEHLQRINVQAIVQPSPDLPNYTRIHYLLPKDAPLVSIIIPTYNHLDLLKACISSIIDKTTYKPYEIIVIDNNSDELSCLNYLETLEKNNICQVIRDKKPFNFSRINNAAVPYAQGEILAFVNNDIEFISPEWLTEMVSHAIRPNVGVVGAKLFYPDNTLQHAGVIVGLGGIAAHCYTRFPATTIGYFGRMMLTQNFTAVTAACCLMQKKIFLQAGGFDEKNLAVDYNDVDLCLKIHSLGYRNVWTPYATAYHHESASRGHKTKPEEQQRFAAESQYMQQQWHSLIKNDPAYNPNLTLSTTDFTLDFNPRIKKTCPEPMK
jgi:glycosyltransferase involved in cell wall biosynthesis